MSSKILTFPLVRPTYDDTHIGEYLKWVIDNEAALSRYWEALCRVPMDGTPERVKLSVWLALQWEMECIMIENVLEA
jgi:hypothetical protein